MMEHRNTEIAAWLNTCRRGWGPCGSKFFPITWWFPSSASLRPSFFSASMSLAATSCCQGSWAWKIGIIIQNFWHLMIMVYPQLCSIAPFLAPSWLQTCSSSTPWNQGGAPHSMQTSPQLRLFWAKNDSKGRKGPTWSGDESKVSFSGIKEATVLNQTRNTRLTQVRSEYHSWRQIYSLVSMATVYISISTSLPTLKEIQCCEDLLWSNTWEASILCWRSFESNVQHIQHVLLCCYVSQLSIYSIQTRNHPKSQKLK